MIRRNRWGRVGWRVGVKGSAPQERAKHQCQCHLAAPSRRPAHPGALRAADVVELDLKKCHAIGLGAVGPMLTLLHRRRARRLRLRPRRHHRQRDARGRVQTGRDGAWVRREQSRCSWDPPAHFREAPIMRYREWLPTTISIKCGEPRFFMSCFSK